MRPPPVHSGSKRHLLRVSAWLWLCALCTVWVPMAQAAELVVRLSHVVASEGRIRGDV